MPPAATVWSAGARRCSSARPAGGLEDAAAEPALGQADAIYHRSNQGGGEWEYRRRLPEKWKISCGEGEDKLTLIVSPTGFKHTGVFPEQAVNWAWYAKKIRAAAGPSKC